MSFSSLGLTPALLRACSRLLPGWALAGDADHFKDVHDRHSHAVGDAVPRGVPCGDLEGSGADVGGIHGGLGKRQRSRDRDAAAAGRDVEFLHDGGLDTRPDRNGE